MQPYLFYHQHLDRVSRSFTFCILQLKSGVKEWVALAYLMFRIIDTVEDAPWQSVPKQLAAFEQLREFLESPPSAQALSAWIATFPAQIPEHEKRLLIDLPILLQDKNELPSTIQQVLLETMHEMMNGMIYFIQHFTASNRLTLNTMDEANQYCFYVAGTVGKLLTKMIEHVTPGFHASTERLNQSVQFGLFLQKINILNDRVHDEMAGRCFIPTFDEMRASLVEDAEGALSYIKMVPISAGRHYRIFCAWSLFLGLASLRWIDRNWQMKTQDKISARETDALISKVRRCIDDNHALDGLFEVYAP
jgi:phytoene/squalene synthetase